MEISICKCTGKSKQTHETRMAKHCQNGKRREMANNLALTETQ